MSIHKTKKLLLLVYFCSCPFMGVVADLSAEVYEFEIMWPTELEQPWYFNSPSGVAVDTTSNVYVVDSNNQRIQKFDLNGVFITKCGSFGTIEWDGKNDVCEYVASGLLYVHIESSNLKDTKKIILAR